MLSYYGRRARSGTSRPWTSSPVRRRRPSRTTSSSSGFTAHGLMDVRPTPFDWSCRASRATRPPSRTCWRVGASRRPWTLTSSKRSRSSCSALVGPLLLPRVGAIWGTVVALGLAVGTTGLVHLRAFATGVWISAAPTARRPRRRARRERDLPGVDRGARAPVDQAGVPAVRAAGGRRRSSGRDPAKLTFGGERRILTVIFSDIRGFCPRAEKDQLPGHARPDVLRVGPVDACGRPRQQAERRRDPEREHQHHARAGHQRGDDHPPGQQGAEPQLRLARRSRPRPRSAPATSRARARPASAGRAPPRQASTRRTSPTTRRAPTPLTCTVNGVGVATTSVTVKTP